MTTTYLSTASLLPILFFSGMAHTLDKTPTTSTLGIGYINTTKYSGSDERMSSAVPYFHIQYDDVFLDSAEGLGFTAGLANGVYFTQALNYTLGRAERDGTWRSGSAKLKGMGKIKSALTTSTTLGWSYSNILAIEGSLTAPLTDSQGISYRAGIKYSLWSDNKDTLVLSANALFGDARYNNTWYGVSEKQSVASGYQRYSAGSGLYSVDTGLIWTHGFNDHWWSYVDISYSHLTHRASKSGIVYRNGQVDFSAGVLYSF